EQQRNRPGLPGHRGVIPTPDSTTPPNMLVNSEIAFDATVEFTRWQRVDDEVVVSVAADPNPERETPARDAGDAYQLLGQQHRRPHRRYHDGACQPDSRRDRSGRGERNGVQHA